MLEFLITIKIKKLISILIIKVKILMRNEFYNFGPQIDRAKRLQDFKYKV